MGKFTPNDFQSGALFKEYFMKLGDTIEKSSYLTYLVSFKKNISNNNHEYFLDNSFFFIRGY
jgi:hypothetical protein